MRSRVIGQIHDSIAIDAHKNELQDVLDATKRIMEFDVRRHWDWIITPLMVEVDVSFTNWFEKSPWVETPGGNWSSKA
jgi:DNA polymerase I-like protein with 3'-5' exonuclease and polymerase domains